MGQIEDLRVYITIVDCSGISRAAEELNIAKSAVSRRLSQLEDRYETLLIDRVGGTWALTDAGRELYQRAIHLLDMSDELDSDFKQNGYVLSGPLIVSVPAEFGLAFLQPTLLEFQARHPEIQLHVDFDDRRVDLERENYDLAIRIANGLGDHSAGHSLGTIQRGLYASPRYIEEFGAPQSISELEAHRLLYYGREKRGVWTFGSKRTEKTLDFSPALQSNSGQWLYQATLKGLGISRLPSFIAKEATSRGELIAILSDLYIPSYSISLVYSPSRRVNHRMLLFADEVALACQRL